tara:strand:- start:152 stop:409 length:258 start_codon:yes stop_codon:yes gene_type:complete
MSKLVSEGALGDTMSDGFELGDLVSWSEWMIVDNDIAEIVYYGTIIDKIVKIMGGRPIRVIIVACSKTGDIISLSPFQLRLEETS